MISDDVEKLKVALKDVIEKIWEIENRLEDLEEKVEDLSGALFDRGVVG